MHKLTVRPIKRHTNLLDSLNAHKLTRSCWHAVRDLLHDGQMYAAINTLPRRVTTDTLSTTASCIPFLQRRTITTDRVADSPRYSRTSIPRHSSLSLLQPSVAATPVTASRIPRRMPRQRSRTVTAGVNSAPLALPGELFKSALSFVHSATERKLFGSLSKVKEVRLVNLSQGGCPGNVLISVFV